MQRILPQTQHRIRLSLKRQLVVSLTTSFMVASTVLFGSCFAADAEQIHPEQTPAEQTPAAMLEKHYRQAAFAFYQQQPYQAVLQLELAPVQDARSLLLKAGLLLELGMPQQAAALLEQVLALDSADLPNDLRQFALLQYSRYLFQRGDVTAARATFAKVQPSEVLAGPQQQLQQLMMWPNIELPAEPEFGLLRDHPEMPYIISNQLLQHAQNGDVTKAMQWLDALRSEVDTTIEPMFWRRWFGLTPPWQATDPIEQQGVRDYLQLLKAQLLLQQADLPAAQQVLREFPQDSALSEMALALYATVLDQARQVPELLAVYQQQIRKHPFAEQSWRAANLIGLQFELSGDGVAALAAYQWADQYYQQQLAANRALEQLNLDELAKGELTPWQQYQVGQQTELFQLQQDLLQLEQLAEVSPQQHLRIAHLQQVVDIKLAQQEQLLAEQLPRLTAQFATLNAQQQHLTEQLAKARAAEFSPTLLSGDAFKQQQRLDKAAQLVERLANAKAAGVNLTVDVAKQRKRLALLQGISRWQYALTKAEREWAIEKELKQINHLLPNIEKQLTSLQQAGQATPRLRAQQQQLLEFAKTQQRAEQNIMQQQQQLLTEFNLQLQRRADEQHQQLTELARSNKQAIARMMEAQLRTSPQPPESAVNGEPQS